MDALRTITAGSRARRASIPALLCAGIMAAALLGVEKQAYALQGGEDPALLPVLIDKRFGMEGRHQASVLFSTTMVSKFTESTGFGLSYQYNFTDMLGVEVAGGYYFSDETKIMKAIRAEFGGNDPELSDLHQMQYTAMANLVFTPLYGKMSFASEWNPSFDLYVFAGAGLLGTRKLLPGGSAADLFRSGQYESSAGFGFDVGFGLHLYITDLIALRLDFRQFFYPDPDSGNINSKDMEEISGLSSLLQLQAGLQFNFGGED